MVWLLVILFAGLGIILMALVSMLLGKGHLDADQSESHYLDEVEITSRNFHF